MDQASIFTPLSIDPAPLVLMTWAEIQETFGGFRERARNVYATEDYAVKVVPLGDKDLSNEIHMSNLLNSLAPQTHVFAHGHGYVLSSERPRTEDEGATPPVASEGYAYLFSELIDAPFSELPDEPQVNEDYYFELLIGLYYARKTFHFTHFDVHTGNLMWNRLDEPTTRTYRIGSSPLFVVIRNSRVQPKLIDYGKSAADPTYSDAQWQEARFKKMWSKSDIYHLSRLISHRTNLSTRFRAFLEETVLPRFRSSMYAVRLEQDSAANHQNIHDLLQEYFGDQLVQCVACGDRRAEYVDGNGAFCGEACQIRFYDGGNNERSAPPYSANGIPPSPPRTK